MKKGFSFFAYGLITLVTIMLANALILATETASNTITVVATVLPVRIIVVDHNLMIQKIISNTAEETRPIVVLGEVDGKEVPYSQSILEQYQQLKPSINFSKPGMVYQRDERPIPALIKRIWRSITKWFV